jgi:hypothetical protein
MGILTGLLTAGLYSMAGNAISDGMRTMSCERAIPYETRIVANNQSACTRTQSRVTAIDTEIKSLETKAAQTTIDAKTKKRLESRIKSKKRTLVGAQKTANKSCDRLVKSTAKLDSAKKLCNK